jgi:DHA2 family multidrug resistance protein-like MFS transporter
MNSSAAGTILGPIVGGKLVELLWWGAPFLLAIPVMVVLLILGPTFLPKTQTNENARTDPVSVVLSLMSGLLIVYGIQQLANEIGQPWPLIALVSGVVFALLFTHRQRTLADPLLQTDLFRIRSFRAIVVLALIGPGVPAAFTLVISRYFQMVKGMSPSTVALWMLPQSALAVLATYSAPFIARRVKVAYLIPACLVIATAGGSILTIVDHATGPTTVALGGVLACAGLGPAVALGINLAIGDVYERRAGAASSVLATSNEFGIVLVVAILNTIGSLAYSNHLHLSSSLPDEIVATSHEDIEGAVRAASFLPPQVASDLLDKARESFISSMHITAVAGAVLLLLSSTVVGLTLGKNKR